ncbi:hemerythrin domain-containing protein [Iodidimonas sp. SYSU 1G8]|uniref:hemerythrin domain-containing protein n=1 Tax=Iodidimonas sp. SYSU 1G8 TaxID=3133967 RepID=UPI0031FE7A71
MTARADATAKTANPKAAQKTATTETRAKQAAIAEARSVAPDLAARIGSTPATTFRGNPDIFGRLVEDHDRHRALFAMVQDTDAKSPQREALFEELVKEIQSHAAAEEQALWSTVLRNPETTEDARHAVHEHKQIDEMVADLAARDPATAAWMTRFGELKEKYLHHIREEEQEQFVAAEEHLSASDISHMKSVFNRRKKAEKAEAVIEEKIRLKH